MKEQLEELVKKWEAELNYIRTAPGYSQAFAAGKISTLEQCIRDLKTILQQHA